MINSFTDEQEIIEAHFKKVWGDTTPILFENTRKSPPTKGKWVRFTILNSEKQQASIGTSQLHRNTGQVVVQVFGKKGTKLSEITEKADMVISAFDVQQLDSIQFRAAYKINVGETGEWYQINVIAPFYRNSIVTTQ